MNKLTECPEWHALIQHHQRIAHAHMRDWFQSDETRFARYSLKVGPLFLDYSRNRILDDTMHHLFKLAEAARLSDKMNALFTGKAINTTEKRPALHTALRDRHDVPIFVNGSDIRPLITQNRNKIRDFVDKIHRREWLGVTGKPISHLVNIGIGGSYIGPMMCSHALKTFCKTDLTLHFISTVDKIPLMEVQSQIDPETTLFIISSKSFNTIETMTNAATLIDWMKTRLGEKVIQNHFVAVTAHPEKAQHLGLPQENIFLLWDWIGGRYSIWSAIALPLILMIGNDHFDAFLAGAEEMDTHFRSCDFSENMPVILALLGIWYQNFFGAQAEAIAPYTHRLRYFIPYVQQVEMESNGKRTDLNGDLLSYLTSPVIFGEEGCRGQHAYHQLLHQGQHFIPVNFILTQEASEDTHYQVLLASALSQAQALMRGKTYDEALNELRASGERGQEAKVLAQHRVIPGNRPCHMIVLDSLTPRSLGMLIALFEHKIFVQGAIWGINSFDQWGVELGKQLLPCILRSIQGEETPLQLDSATIGMIHYLKNRIIE